MIDLSVSDDSTELILAVDFPHLGERQHWNVSASTWNSRERCGLGNDAG
jgi:hypothetical protein